MGIRAIGVVFGCGSGTVFDHLTRDWIKFISRFKAVSMAFYPRIGFRHSHPSSWSRLSDRLNRSPIPTNGVELIGYLGSSIGTRRVWRNALSWTWTTSRPAICTLELCASVEYLLFIAWIMQLRMPQLHSGWRLGDTDVYRETIRLQSTA